MINRLPLVRLTAFMISLVSMSPNLLASDVKEEVIYTGTEPAMTALSKTRTGTIAFGEHPYWKAQGFVRSIDVNGTLRSSVEIQSQFEVRRPFSRLKDGDFSFLDFNQAFYRFNDEGQMLSRTPMRVDNSMAQNFSKFDDDSFLLSHTFFEPKYGIQRIGSDGTLIASAYFTGSDGGNGSSDVSYWALKNRNVLVSGRNNGKTIFHLLDEHLNVLKTTEIAENFCGVKEIPKSGDLFIGCRTTTHGFIFDQNLTALSKVNFGDIKPTSIVFATDGTAIVGDDFSGQLVTYDSHWKEINRLKLGQSVSSIQIMPSGRILANISKSSDGRHYSYALISLNQDLKILGSFPIGSFLDIQGLLPIENLNRIHVQSLSDKIVLTYGGNPLHGLIQILDPELTLIYSRDVQSMSPRTPLIYDEHHMFISIEGVKDSKAYILKLTI